MRKMLLFAAILGFVLVCSMPCLADIETEVIAQAPTDTLISPNYIEAGEFFPAPYDCISFHRGSAATVALYMHYDVGTPSCFAGHADGEFYEPIITVSTGVTGCEFTWNGVKLVLKFPAMTTNLGTNFGKNQALLYIRTP